MLSLFALVNHGFSETLNKPKVRPEITQIALEVMAMCGASSGTGYFFKDTLYNPEGGRWLDDGISNGQITLVRDGESYDILFMMQSEEPDTGEKDGAQVFMLHSGEKFIRVGASAKLWLISIILIVRTINWSGLLINQGHFLEK